LLKWGRGPLAFFRFPTFLEMVSMNAFRILPAGGIPTFEDDQDRDRRSPSFALKFPQTMAKLVDDLAIFLLSNAEGEVNLLKHNESLEDIFSECFSSGFTMQKRRCSDDRK
jgi:hypothetical protein